MEKIELKYKAEIEVLEQNLGKMKEVKLHLLHKNIGFSFGIYLKNVYF